MGTPNFNQAAQQPQYQSNQSEQKTLSQFQNMGPEEDKDMGEDDEGNEFGTLDANIY